jgi:hypothetical protein
VDSARRLTRGQLDARSRRRRRRDTIVSVKDVIPGAVSPDLAEGYVPRHRNYWTYSCGLAVAWAIVFVLTFVIRGHEGPRTVLPVFLGFCVGWVSTTIARYVYPPPRRWTAS